MKKLLKFIKGRWFPSLVLLVGLAFVLLVGFLLGFRITYAPALENSWEAISGVAAWVSAGATIAAVWAAIQIPKKIAEQQERVELYEKRLNFYDTLNDCISFSDSVNNISSMLQIKYIFILTFGPGTVPGRTGEQIREAASPLFHQAIKSLRSGEFLFGFEVKKYAQNIASALTDLLYPEDIDVKTIKDHLMEYQAAVNEARKDLVPPVKDTLKLWQKK